MEIPPALLQFLGSLAAILVLAGIAWRLRLGPERPLADEDSVREAAEETLHGFEPVAIAIDRDGKGALVRDGDGNIMLLRPHGTHVAGRLLTPLASVRIESERLIVDSGERRFGSVSLELDDASAWVQHVNAIKAG